MSMSATPSRGASLLLSFRMHSRAVVILGSGKLAANRAFSCLQSDAHVVVLAGGGLNNACEEIRWRVARNEIEWRSIEEEAKLWRSVTPSSCQRTTEGDEAEEALHSVLSSIPSVSFFCITDTMIPSTSTSKVFERRSAASAMRLYDITTRIYRIPTNTSDMPALCDFTFPSTHRFRSAKTGEFTALQVGVVTNSKGCRLSSRITREIVARLPSGVGDAVDNVGRLRERAKANENITLSTNGTELQVLDEDCENIPSTPNEPVPQGQVAQSAILGTDAQTSLEAGAETTISQTQRRIRWTSQVSEYWPLESLASLDDEGIEHILDGLSSLVPRAVHEEDPSLAHPKTLPPAQSRHSIKPLIRSSTPPRGRILLLGSGPGHPSLLTLATSHALQTADLVLSDKLVPENVLRAIPKRKTLYLSHRSKLKTSSDVELRIARKFPGNADRAQDELMHAALEAARQGNVVVRLKQGDPMLYARASSEIEYFTAHGFPPTVVPGISSALAAPLAAGIPVTARGVAEGVAICTGVSKGGKSGRIPPYERSVTVLVLMGVARLAEILHAMLSNSYPNYLPTCIIERGTMPDQRVVQSTLGGMIDAMADYRVGAQRPPGMIIAGWACLGIAEGVEGVSDDEGEGLRDRDLERVRKWLRGERFAIKEGLDETWQGL